MLLQRPMVNVLRISAANCPRRLRVCILWVVDIWKLRIDVSMQVSCTVCNGLRPNATFRFWIPDTRFCREDDQNLVSGVLKCPQPGYLRASGIQNFEASGNLIPHFQVCSHLPCCLAAATCRLPGGSVASTWVPHVSWPLLSAAVAIAVLSRQPVS